MSNHTSVSGDLAAVADDLRAFSTDSRGRHRTKEAGALNILKLSRMPSAVQSEGKCFSHMDSLWSWPTFPAMLHC